MQTMFLDSCDRYFLDYDYFVNAGNWLWISASAFSSAFYRVYSPVQMALVCIAPDILDNRGNICIVFFSNLFCFVPELYWCRDICAALRVGST